MGATITALGIPGQDTKFQLPPRVGATGKPSIVNRRKAISTPAPRVGATQASRRKRQNPISTPAPAWGATSGSTSSSVTSGISTPAPAWGRRMCFGRITASMGISTPAPAWGRHVDNPLMQVDVHFNSRPRVGGDLWGGNASAQGTLFQLPPRVGGDTLDKSSPT